MTATITTTAVTRIRTWVVAATTRSTNHYTITAITAELTFEGTKTHYKNNCSHDPIVTRYTTLRHLTCICADRHISSCIVTFGIDAISKLNKIAWRNNGNIF